jgi:four helix bundle protein
MIAKQVQDLKLWQRAMQFWKAIDDILDRPGLLRDRRLKDQLSDAADSIVSNISEGFEQGSDRAFSRYLYDAKASNAEARARLLLARQKGYITAEEHEFRDGIGDEVARMTVGLIKHLLRSDRKHRGVGQRTHRNREL